MAAPSAVTAESLITLKINHDGANKRFKLPLRDLGAATLETKVPHVIPSPADCPIPSPIVGPVQQHTDSLSSSSFEPF